MSRRQHVASQLQGPNELTHELAGLLDGTLRHVRLAINQLSVVGNMTISDKPVDHLETAHDALRQMAGLLHEWQRGARHPAATPASETLGDAAQQAVRLVHPMARQLGVVLTLELADGAATLPAGALRRVLDNALRNSLEAIEADASPNPQTPAITVSARLEAAMLVLTVSDTGPGLSEAVLDERGRFVFGRSSKAACRGTGLQLAQRIAEELGGQVMLSNRSPRGALLELRCSGATLND